jgi:hypothetical protein
MPTELVLLSDVEPTSMAMVRAAAQLHPDGTFLDFRDGQIRQFVDATGRALLAVYPTRAVVVAREAAAAVVDPPASFRQWTDLAIPFGDPAAGRALAEAIAAAVGGVVRDRI